jgi:hypothetical protein
VLSDERQKLRDFCKDIKEEVCRHLAAIEGFGSDVTNLMIAVFFASITFILTVVNIFISQYNVSGIQALIIGFTILAIILLSREWLWNRHVKTIQKAGGIMSNSFKIRYEIIKKYVAELKKCCAELSNNKCDHAFITACLELDELNGLVDELSKVC